MPRDERRTGFSGQDHGGGTIEEDVTEDALLGTLTTCPEFTERLYAEEENDESAWGTWLSCGVSRM